MMSRGQLMAQLAMMLGGRAAERVVFDEITTGASNDLERVTQTARQMVTRFGMSEKLGPMALGHQQGQVFMGRDFNNQPDYSDEIAFQIDKEIRRIVDESYDTAEDLLVRNRDLLNKLSSELIEYETVDANHLKRLIEEYAVDSISPNGAVPDSGDEVGRSAVLVGGYAEVTHRTTLPLRVLEIGASAGLNLRWDHFAYDTGRGVSGDPDSPVRFSGVWVGDPPDLPRRFTVADA